jgi:hypothetical protein
VNWKLKIEHCDSFHRSPFTPLRRRYCFDAAVPGVSPHAIRIWSSKRRQVLVPEGHLTIAQRFNVGKRPRCGASPKGTAGWARIFSRPFGTRGVSRHRTNVETLGYYRESLRDEERILALDVSHRLESGKLSGRRPPDQLVPGELFCESEKQAAFNPGGETRALHVRRDA